jgi:Uma2 family endonuclease
MAKAKPASELPRTVEAFDRWHATQPERWEFIAGRPVMMAPGSRPHTIIKGNIFRHLGNKLAGKPCRPYVDGAEVKGHKLSAIPDVVVECRPPDLRSPTIAEPVLIVEVLSPWSERDDTGRKWRGYCLIASLQHYLVVSQEDRFATLHSRTGPSSWAETVHEEGTVDLPAIGAALSLDEIYEGVDFTTEPAAGDG